MFVCVFFYMHNVNGTLRLSTHTKSTLGQCIADDRRKVVIHIKFTKHYLDKISIQLLIVSYNFLIN